MKGKLYHGTCRAFIEYALQNQGRFGPDYDSVSFTPDYEHARMFAEQWKTDAGKEMLKQYFDLDDENLEQLLEPLVLEFDANNLGELKQREDGNAVEFYVERGPISLNEAKVID